MNISSQDSKDPNQRNRLLVPICDRNHIQKIANSSIVLVNYGDYQCPRSGIAHQTIKTIQQQFNHPFSFVFRHFPQPG
ncbi:DsbA family protein [Aerosakkonemataceae cyanobacterium BLCC-F50]|uniref:DsbA family protein n=1 Tax=Floridaenema flaviceps BLCC-F50 TaxID=3153642 RepID=A0ABV4XU34_9CYAN